MSYNIVNHASRTVWFDLDNTLLHNPLEKYWDMLMRVNVLVPVLLFLYKHMYRNSRLSANSAVVELMTQYYEQGYTIYVLTNRFSEQGWCSIANLERIGVAHMVTSYAFCGGKKSSLSLPGIVVGDKASDNVGDGFIHV